LADHRAHLSCAAIVAPPWLLVLIQPDLGECLVQLPMILALLFVGRIPKRYLLVMIVCGLALVPVVANFGLKPYQRERLTTFINPDYDTQGAAWTINQSLIAIGSGGFYGKGFTAPNTQVDLGFLPQTIVHTDFIFAAIFGAARFCRRCDRGGCVCRTASYRPSYRCLCDRRTRTPHRYRV